MSIKVKVWYQMTLTETEVCMKLFRPIGSQCDINFAEGAEGGLSFFVWSPTEVRLGWDVVELGFWELETINGHFGLWCCRRWASAPSAARLVFLISNQSIYYVRGWGRRSYSFENVILSCYIIFIFFSIWCCSIRLKIAKISPNLFFSSTPISNFFCKSLIWLSIINSYLLILFSSLFLMFLFHRLRKLWVHWAEIW